ncbi:MAG: hypothetical protein ACYC7E_09120 [Armatimonadota bacterium]
MRRLLLVLAVCAMGVLWLGNAVSAAPDGKSIGVLFTSMTVDREIIRDFRSRGIHINWNDLDDVNKRLEHLAPYNVLVLTVDDNYGNWATAAREFLRAGGGVLCIGNMAGPAAEAWYAKLKAGGNLELLAFFKELGYSGPTGPPFADPRVDCELSEWWKGFGLSLTTNIPASPVSEGVQRVWYPNWIWGREEWKQQSGGMVLSPEWQVTLRANRSVAGSANDAPVLFAQRAWGAGRVAVTPISPIYYFNSGTHSTIRKRVYATGINNVPSDFHRLLENTIRWLAAPSLANGKPGGYLLPEDRINPKPFIRRPYEFGSTEVEAKAADIFEMPPQDYINQGWITREPTPIYRGLIGCQSDYSGGKAPVAAFAAAAKQAGLHFIVFLEDFTRMTPEKLKRLEADCRAASSEAMICLPGLLIPDDADHLCYYYGRNLTWPEPGVLTTDGKALATRNAKSGPKSRNKGNAAPIGVLSFIHDGSSVFKGGPDAFPQAFGYCRFTPFRETAPMWDLRVFSSVALEYAEGERVIDRVDEMLPDFRHVNHLANDITPIAISRVGDPAMLERAVAGGRYLTHVFNLPRIDRPLDFRVMSRLRYVYWEPNSVFVSNGPLIHVWRGLQRDYYPSNLQGYLSPVPNTRYRLYLDVSAEAGIKEIAIWDGMHLFRRFLPAGEMRVKKEIDCLHDRQRHFMMVVTDLQGRKAISAVNICHANYRWLMCSDRVNGDICKGPFYFLKRASIEAGGKIVEMPPFTDAHFPRQGIALRTMPTIYFKAGTPYQAEGAPVPLPNQQWQVHLAADNVRKIGIKCFKDYLPDEVVANGWNTFGPLAPPRTLTMEQTFTEYWPVGALSVQYNADAAKYAQRTALFDVKIDFLRDFQASTLDIFTVRMAQEDYLFAALAPDRPGSAVCGPAVWNGASFPLRKGCFFAGFPLKPGKAGGGMYILLDDTPLVLKPFGKNGLRAELSNGIAAGVKKGDSVRYRMLIIGNNTGERPANLAYYAGLYRFLGFEGTPGYTLEFTQGTAANNTGVLSLNARDGAVAFKYRNASGPQQFRLPVVVRGLNDRWTAGIYHVGKPWPMYPAGCQAGEMPFALDADQPVDLLAGHPVIADRPEVFIQFVQLAEKPARFLVTVNNPTDKTLRVRLRKGLALPGFAFPGATITLAPGGEWRWEG